MKPTGWFKEEHEKARLSPDYWEAKCEEIEEGIKRANARIRELEAENEHLQACLRGLRLLDTVCPKFQLRVNLETGKSHA
jgi:hypothetical protein